MAVLGSGGDVMSLPQAVCDAAAALARASERDFVDLAGEGERRQNRSCISFSFARFLAATAVIANWR